MLLLAGILSLATPQASTPPVIITVHSRAECVTRLQATGYAVPGLRMNDRIVQRSQIVLAVMAKHTAENASTAQRTLDVSYLERLTSAMMHNLKALKGLIAQVAATTKSNQPDPLVDRLRGIYAVQSHEMDTFNGIAETTRMDALQDDNPDAMIAASAGDIPRGGVPRAGVQEPVFDAGLPNSGLLPNAIPTTSPVFPANSIYGPLAQSLSNDAALTDQRENDLASTIRDEVSACSGAPK